MFDLVIKNGSVVDGTGNPWYRADIAVSGRRITAIGSLGSNAERLIEAGGLVVAPGFIDTHSHSDLMLMAEPEARQKLMQGVTTEVVGQDGLGEAPIRDDVIDDWRRYLSGLNGNPDVDWDWRSFKEYLDRLDKVKPAVNVACLVGHGNLRLLSVGMENRPPTAYELEQMKKLLEAAICQGAFGLSTGLIYPPCIYADTKELVELCKVTSKLGCIFMVHMRNEGERLLESIGEVVEIGRKTGVPVHISHFKVGVESNWGKASEALSVLEDARLKDVDVTVDQYPYTAGSTFLSSLVPAWAHEGGAAKMIERLQNAATRNRVALELMESGSGRTRNWKKVMVTSVETEGNKRFEGMTVQGIADIKGIDPIDAVLDLILEEDNAVTMASFSMSEDDVRTIMQSPLQMVCTDGIVLGRPHPRVYGSFPRVLGKYVRGGVLRLEDAVRKMTSLPAQRFGLFNRGVLKPGMSADITIFDPEKVVDKATYEDPIQYPEGVEYVVNNGRIIVEEGVHTGIRSGKVLKHRPWSLAIHAVN
jgi:N-acyl-D-amino-acid deacylase